MDKLASLLAHCKCGVYLTANAHRDLRQTVDQALTEMEDFGTLPEFGADVRVQMVITDTVIDLQFYPATPIGCRHLLHYDLEAALDAALGCLEGLA